MSLLLHGPSLAFVAWAAVTAGTGWVCPAGWLCVLGVAVGAWAFVLWRRYRR